MLRMALFVAIISVAFLFDSFLDRNPAELDTIQAESGEQQSHEPGNVYLIAQSSTITLKTAGEKSFQRKLRVHLHDKFLQKYHQIRNYQILKAEHSTQTTPIIQSYHYLVFQNYFYTQLDEDSLA